MEKTTKLSRALEERFGEACLIPPTWGEVNEHNCLDLFALSQFYDRESNNEVLARQHKSLEGLSQLRGLEFARLPTTRPPLLLIAKQFRHDKQTTTCRAIFYFNNQMFLQSPNVRELCVKRLRNASEHFDQVASHTILRTSSSGSKHSAATRKLAAMGGKRQRERLRKLRANEELLQRTLEATSTRLQHSCTVNNL